MNIYDIKAKTKSTNHMAKKERRLGKIPGVLYGKEVGNLMFEIGEIELNKAICENGEHGIIEVNLGDNIHKALIKEIQKDPVDHRMLHIDLQDLDEEKMVIVDVPIIFMGEDNVIKQGGIIQKEKSSVKVQCSSNNIPKYINVDLSGISQGNAYRVSDIELSEGMCIVDDFSALIATITDSNIKDMTVNEASGNI